MKKKKKLLLLFLDERSRLPAMIVNLYLNRYRNNNNNNRHLFVNHFLV